MQEAVPLRLPEAAMSTESMLIGLLVHKRSGAEAEEIAKRVLALHAHELAEKQRARASTYALMRSETMRLRAAGAREVADLIDPEVST